MFENVMMDDSPGGVCGGMAVSPFAMITGDGNGVAAEAVIPVHNVMSLSESRSLRLPP